jgi:hypothetical protein
MPFRLSHAAMATSSSNLQDDGYPVTILQQAMQQPM